MNWVAWKGENVGTGMKTVCVCVCSYFIEGDPDFWIIPNAYCISDSRDEIPEWYFYVGETSEVRELNKSTIVDCISSRSKSIRRFADADALGMAVYDPSRGDKIFYCFPTLPDGSRYDLNDIKKNQFQGIAITWTKNYLSRKN